MRRGSFWRGLIAGGIIGVVASNMLMGRTKPLVNTERLVETSRLLRGGARRILRQGRMMARMVRRRFRD